MSVVQRLKEIVRAIRAAKVPPPPKRRYDLASEAMARPFGESAGRAALRAGGVTDEEPNPEA